METDRLADLPSHALDGGMRVAVAATRATRLHGLARLDRLAAGEALHIPRCRSVHTFTMRFPLDLIWLDGEGRVARIDRGVGPRRMRTCLRAKSVVECNAGAADELLAAGLERLALN